MDLTNSNTDLLGLYMAAMTKAVLENTTDKLNSDEIYNRAEKIIVNYCSNADNKMKPSKKIKQLIKEMQ
jgi:6-phosphogluconate dehydrogenase